MGKIAKHNNKVHIAGGKDNPARIFTKFTDIVTEEESYGALEDQLLRPGSGTPLAGDVTFVLHGADCNMGAIAIIAKGASILVYTTDGGDTPREMKISGADNIELIAVQDSVYPYIYFVDNKSSGAGSVVYALTYSEFDAYLASNEVADLRAKIVEFDFTDQTLGRYGSEIEPDNAVNELGNGFSVSAESHFLYDAKTTNGINPFYVADLKFDGYYEGSGFMYIQLQNPSRELTYNANECVIYRWMPQQNQNIPSTVYNISLTNDEVNYFEPAFFPCEFLGASRSLASADNKPDIDGWGDVDVDNDAWQANFDGSGLVGQSFSNGANTTIRANNHLENSTIATPFTVIQGQRAVHKNYAGSQSGYYRADNSTLYFDLYGRLVGQHYLMRQSSVSSDYFLTIESDDYWSLNDRIWAYSFIDTDANGDISQQSIPVNEAGADFVFSRDLFGDGIDWLNDGDTDQEDAGNWLVDVDAVNGLERSLDSFYYHGSAKVTYLKQALVYNKCGGGNAGDINLLNISMSVLASPARSSESELTNYWVKYRQLLVADGYKDLSIQSGGEWLSHAENEASMVQSVVTNTVKVDYDTVLSFPCFHSAFIPPNANQELEGLARYNVADILSDGSTVGGTGTGQVLQSTHRFWGTKLNNNESKTKLTSAGHPYFLVNNNGTDPSIVTMQTVKFTKSQNYNPMYHGFVDYGNWPNPTSHPSGNLYSDPIFTTYGPWDQNIIQFANAINSTYDINGCRNWTWAYSGANTLDKELKFISVWNVSNIGNAEDSKLLTIPDSNTAIAASQDNTHLCPLNINNPNYLLLEHHLGLSITTEGLQTYFDFGGFEIISTPTDEGLNSKWGDSVETSIGDGDKISDINPTSSGEEASIIFNMGVTGQASDGTDAFIAPFTVNYKYSFMYDGHQESPLSLMPQSMTEATANKSTAKIDLEYLPSSLDPRITHVNIYSKYIKSNGTGDSSYKLSKSIPFRPIAKWTAQTNGLYKYSYFDDNSVAPSYETLTGISESLIDSSMRYNISAASDSYLFVGECSQPSLSDDFSNYIFRSMQGKFSQFNWSRDYQILPEVPTAMVSFGGRLFVFSSNSTFRLNQATLEVEDVFEGVGCDNASSIITTEYGMCFADQNNIYLHDGKNPQVISQTIARGSKDSYVDGSAGWQDTNKSYIRVSFDSKRKSYLIFFSYRYQNVLYNRCWAYNILYKRWDLLSSPGRITNTFIEDNGTVLLTTKDANANNIKAFRYLAGNTLKDWSWTSKDLIMGGATQDKKIKKIRINSSDSIDSSNIDISYNNGIDLASTLKEELSGDLKHTSITPNSRASFKSLRVSLNDIEGSNEVDSIGVIYRPRSIK